MEAKPVLVKPKEEKLLEKIREISYGRLTVFIENHEPVRLDEIKESVKL